MEKVLLIGIGGVYNYGCEAIVRGTVRILKSVNPAVEIYYASYNAEDDRKRLADCAVRIIDRPKRRRWTVHNILRKCLSYVGISYPVPYDKADWLKGFDTVFSIGGDIYTLSHTGGFDASLPRFMEKCQKRGMKYVLWGASVGKFEKNAAALAFYRAHLPKIDLIVAREKNTADYLQALGVTGNVRLAPDPAFFVEIPKGIERKQKGGKLTVGINLSPLSALYEYGDLDAAIRRQASAIARLMEQLGCQVILLPHVLSPNPQDNDLVYLREIRESIGEPYQSDIWLVDNDPGFVGLKRVLCQCDFVIAARMHCAVNAITVDVPTLFLSYSEKAKGMAEFVYGSGEAVVSLADLENTALIADRLKNWHQVSRINEIRQFDFSKLLK